MNTFIDKWNKNKILVKYQNLAHVLFYKMRETSVSLQIGSEVGQDEQHDELLRGNKNIEETQHDFTTSKQITTEPDQSS